jgi:NADH dehydrogenase FAD-containing subunit
MAETQTRIVVIGAGYAGMLAAVRLAGKTRRQNVAITLVNAEDVFVERLRLHQLAANHPVRQRPIRDTLRGTGVDFVQGVVIQIDTARREIVVQTGQNQRRVAYDKLLYALGSTIDRDSVPGVRDHAYTLTYSGSKSAAALRNLLPDVAARGGRLVIGGGGATGIEAAAEFADSYPQLQVRLVTRGEMGLFLGKDVAAYMRQSLEARSVKVQDHTHISEIQAGQIITAGGEAIPYDVCLWTGGFSVPALAREAGIAVNERGQILVDPFLRSTSHPDIYAVGDAASPVEAPGVPVRMSAFTACIMGAGGADSLAAAVRGRTPRPFSFVYLGQGIALGHGNAIGFNNYPADKPNHPYFTGRAGYAIREFFVNFLAGLPAIERRIPGFFYWLGKGRYARLKREAARQSSAQARAS